MKGANTLDFPGRRLQVSIINGSANIPLNHLQERVAEIPRDRRIAVPCAGGSRSSIATGIPHQCGITRLIEMAGGLAAWEAAKHPVVSEVNSAGR